MRKRFSFLSALLVAAVLFTACSSNEAEGGSELNETGTFDFTLEFSGSHTRASSAVPPTDWSSINKIQFFLYDAAGKVCFSAITDPGSGASEGTSKKYTYPSIPVGTYTVVAVANAQSASDAVATYGSDGTNQQQWTEGNVYSKQVANMLIKHKASTWPTYYTANTDINSALNVNSLTPHLAPAEVFMGSAASVSITNGGTTNAAITLKREMGLMRVRIDQTTNVEGSLVNFTKAQSGVLLYCLPSEMKISAGTTGGVGSTSNAVNAVSVQGAYESVDPSYGTIIEGNYKLWKDVVVFPNNGGRVNDGAPDANAGVAQKYFIVICGVAEAGHKYSDGTAANAGDLVFWHALIDKRFTPNKIHEVNIVVKTGGSPTPPPTIVQTGGLTITVSTPMAWDSNIITTDKEV